MIELLHYIISHIVDDPDSTRITEEEDGDTIVFNLELPEEIRGVVIGKNGMNIKAIRNLVSIIARRENK
ncbi:MAG: KH domain-containing protein, partial [Candidatus Dojkabacteria bacterium]